MSKPSCTPTKRSRRITAWLKREYRQEEKAKDVDEIDIKLIKLSPRICLQTLNENTATNHQIINQPVKIQDCKNKKLKLENKKDVDDQHQRLRRSARNLPSNEKPVEKFVNKEPNIEDLPFIIFGGRINYIHDFYDIASLCDKLLTDVQNSNDVIVPVGFDLEWPFSFQTGSGKTALAQICLSEKECHLLHLYKLKKLPTSFIEFLSHPKVKLVGVNIKNDVWKLSRDFNEFPGQKVVDNNCLDCGPYANTVINRSCRWSLERLTAYLLKKRISKDPSVRKSKWHIHPLSDAQKIYAATDAYVSLLLHFTIEQKEALSLAEEDAKAMMNASFS